MSAVFGKRSFTYGKGLNVQVGFIGLGRMGFEMASSLSKAGNEVIAYNRTPAKAAMLARGGASISDSPAGACSGKVVFTMLADDEAVEAVVYGPKGYLPTFREAPSMSRAAPLVAPYQGGSARIMPQPDKTTLLRQYRAMQPWREHKGSTS